MAPGQTGIKEKTNQTTPPTRKLKDSPPGRVSYHIARKELAAITKRKEKKASWCRETKRKKERDDDDTQILLQRSSSLHFGQPRPPH